MALRGARSLAVLATCLGTLGTVSCLSLSDAKSNTGGASGNGSIDSGSFPSGGASSDAALETKLYQYAPNTTQWSSVPLASVWHESDAPPTTGIAAATQLSAMDRLLVFTADGIFYRRFDGVWQAPIPIAQSFPMLVGMNIASVFHTPSGADEILTFTAHPMWITYWYRANDVIEIQSWVTLDDYPTINAPPLDSGRSLFDFEGASAVYFGYTDGNLYAMDPNGDWSASPFAQTPYFAAGSGAPDPLSISAAWTDAASGLINFVAP